MSSPNGHGDTLDFLSPLSSTVSTSIYWLGCQIGLSPSSKREQAKKSPDASKLNKTSSISHENRTGRKAIIVTRVMNILPPVHSTGSLRRGGELNQSQLPQSVQFSLCYSRVRDSAASERIARSKPSLNVCVFLPCHEYPGPGELTGRPNS